MSSKIPAQCHCGAVVFKADLTDGFNKKKEFMWKRRGIYVAGSPSEEESRTLLYQYTEPTNALHLEIKSGSFA